MLLRYIAEHLIEQRFVAYVIQVHSMGASARAGENATAACGNYKKNSSTGVARKLVGKW